MIGTVDVGKFEGMVDADSSINEIQVVVRDVEVGNGEIHAMMRRLDLQQNAYFYTLIVEQKAS